MNPTGEHPEQAWRGRDRTVAVLAALAVCGFVAFALHIVIPTSTFYIDEGWAADIGAELSRGRVLYRDVSAPYGPITFHLYALAIGFGGKSFHLLRLCGLGLILLESGVAFLIARKLTQNWRLAILTPVVLWATLGTYQGNRLTASTTAGLFTLLALYCHLLLLEGRRGWMAHGLGGALGLSLLTKQNVFVFDVAAHGLTLVLALFWMPEGQRREYLREMGKATLGLVAPALMFAMFSWPFLSVVMGDTMGTVGGYVAAASIPFPWPTRLIAMDWLERLRGATFYCPLLLGTVATAALAKTRRAARRGDGLGFALTALVAVFQFGQMFPLSDVSHYARSSIAVPVLGVALAGYCARRGQRGLELAAVCLLGLHVWPTTESLYWTVRASRVLPWSELPCNAGIRKDLREEVLLRVLARLREYGDDPVFVAGHHGYLYFLTGRPHVTRQSSPSPYYVHSASEERQIIHDMESAGVRHVVVGPEMFPETGIDKLPVLNEYLQRCYTETEAEGQYRFLDRSPCH